MCTESGELPAGDDGVQPLTAKDDVLYQSYNIVLDRSRWALAQPGELPAGDDSLQPLTAEDEAVGGDAGGDESGDADDGDAETCAETAAASNLQPTGGLPTGPATDGEHDSEARTLDALSKLILWAAVWCTRHM